MIGLGKKDKVKSPNAPAGKPTIGKKGGVIPDKKGEGKMKKEGTVKKDKKVVPVVEEEVKVPKVKDAEVLKAVVDIIVANGGLDTFANAMKIAANSTGEVARVEKNAFSSFIQYRPCKYRTGNNFKDMKCERIVDGQFTPVSADKCKKCNLIAN